jgi:hypothetical protein
MMEPRSCVSLLPFLLATASFAQISQTHPELCGKPNGFVPLPPNVSATMDRSTGDADLFLKSGDSTAKINLPAVVNKIEEVCPLSDGRFVVFGHSGYSASVDIIDSTTATLIDDIWGFSPAMSPNQRWLVYRKFYPRHTDEAVSDEYLLYDLTKTPAQNRPPGIALDDHWDVGRAIFPLGQKNLAGDNIGVPENQQHSCRSESFLWAPDSRAVAFADSVQGKLSIVLVGVDENGNTTASVRTISIAEVCGPATHEGSLPSLDITASELEVEQSGDRSIHLGFLTGMVPNCELKKVDLHLEDFQPAKTEVHVLEKPKRKATIVDQ